MLRIFSTFTGIGGFEYGIQDAYRATIAGGKSDPARDGAEGDRLLASEGQDISTSGGLSSTSVKHVADERPLLIGYSEVDKYAISVFRRHYKGVKNYGDITKINAEQLPDFDCLVGGFPCQAFSAAGRRRGFEDTRGTLFFDLARILRAKRPRLFVFENVKGLLSHDNGKTIRVIVATIAELGYDLQWQIVNSKNNGVPQNRERIILVGHLRGTPRPEVFPLSGGDPASPRADTEIRDVAQTVTASYQKGWKGSHVLVDALYASRPARIYKEVAPTVINYGSGGNKMPMVVDYKHPKSETRRGRLKEGYVGTLDTDVQTGILEGGEIRRLTPLECERLQGFPDDWTKYGVDEDKALKDDRGYYTKETIWDYPVLKYIKKIVRHEEPLVLISDAQRYKMCGNAVTTNVIQAVFERILTDEARSL